MALLALVLLTGCGGADEAAPVADSDASSAPRPAPTSVPTPDAAPAPVAGPTSAAPAPAPQAALLADGPWMSEQPTAVVQQATLMTGSARVTNTSGATLSGMFTYTAVSGGTVLGVMGGSARGVAAGATVTLRLVGAKAFDPAGATFTFKVDG